MSLSLEEWTRRFAAQAARIFARDGALEPMAFVENGEGELHMLPLDFSSADAKELSSLVIREVCRLSKARRVLLVAETWITELPKAVPAELVKRIDRVGVEAAGVPRREIILYSAEDRERQLTAEHEIQRQDGKVWLTELRVLKDAQWSGGRMTNLLPREPRELN
jgi:hypothetical protein